MFGHATTRRLIGVAAVLSGLLLASCSSGPSSSPTTTMKPAPTTSLTSSTSTTSTPVTTAPASTTTTTTVITRVPMQTATGGEFLSPTRNISCEVNSAPPAASMDASGKPLAAYAMCLTVSPARRASLSAAGVVTTCMGESCLSNAGVNTPTLAYGTETGAGPFTCVSLTAGMTCTVSSGKGFSISTSGITNVG